MKRTLVGTVALVAVLGLGASACGSDSDDSSSGTDSTTEATEAPGTSSSMSDGMADASGAAAVATPAAELRAGMTALLQEHVYLAGAAISQAVADGGNMEAPATASAVATLDENSVALS
jgi:hypothetical protein